MIHSKKCFKCNCLKPLAEFYEHSAMADGHLNKCKICVKETVGKHRIVNIEKIREYDRKRSKNSDRIKSLSEVSKLWRNEDKRRSVCHSAVARALKSGALTRLPCNKCGEAKSLAHHENYDEPLNVVWLCQVCHKQRHKEINSMKDNI